MWAVEQASLDKGRAVIFLDPDNGLEIASKKLGHKGSAKYLFIDEFAQMARARHSVIVHQHLGQRHMPRQEYLAAQLQRLSEVRPGYEIFALEGPRSAALCAEPAGRDALSGAAEDLANAWPGERERMIRRP